MCRMIMSAAGAVLLGFVLVGCGEVKQGQRDPDLIKTEKLMEAFRVTRDKVRALDPGTDPDLIMQHTDLKKQMDAIRVQARVEMGQNGGILGAPKMHLVREAIKEAEQAVLDWPKK